MRLNIRPDALLLKDRELGFLTRLIALGGRATLKKMADNDTGVCSSRYAQVVRISRDLEELGFIRRHHMTDNYGGWIEVEIIELQRPPLNKPTGETR